MKVLKYIGSVILLIIGLNQTVPVYLTSLGLLEGQGGENFAYFIGKLLGHAFLMLLAFLIALKLFRSARKSNETKNV